MHYAEILGDPRIAPYKWIANYSASIGLARSTSNAIPSGKFIKPIRIIVDHFLSKYIYISNGGAGNAIPLKAALRLQCVKREPRPAYRFRHD